MRKTSPKGLWLPSPGHFWFLQGPGWSGGWHDTLPAPAGALRAVAGAGLGQAIAWTGRGPAPAPVRGLCPPSGHFWVRPLGPRDSSGPSGHTVWAAAGLPPSPPALQGPASDQGGPCSQLEAADEGGPVPRLPFSCRQREDSQKEALFSEQGARSPAPGGNAEAAGPSEAV